MSIVPPLLSSATAAPASQFGLEEFVDVASGIAANIQRCGVNIVSTSNGTQELRA